MFDIRLPSTLVQSVLDALPTPVFFKDRAGRYQGCNRAFTELDWRRLLIDLPGGRLSIEWAGPGHPVLMTGPASRVYEGQVRL